VRAILTKESSYVDRGSLARVERLGFMADTLTAIVCLSDLQDGQEGVCFAALVQKEKGTDKNGNPYIKCHLRDKRGIFVAPLWADDPLLASAKNWNIGDAFRIRVRKELNQRYGPQLKLFEARPAGTPEDVADGYDFYTLVESSKYPHGSCYAKILGFVESYIKDPKVSELVTRILDAHSELFQKMPAAQNLHHSFCGGLVEHIWSVTRVAIQLANHYASYYTELNPPLNKDVVIAAAILHDIGKLRELEYQPVGARYTKEGNLIGHVLLGRDLVRDTAREIGEFPEETLLLLEHAIVAHHGKPEFGAPKPPATLEALIVHYADELDAKFNAVATELLRSTTEDAFTDKIFAVDNRRFYKGIPIEPPGDLEPPTV
jgi:3'-5' exoribonuclease